MKQQSEFQKGNPLDEGMKMMYEMMYGLDVDQCVRFREDPSKTTVDGIVFAEFIKEKIDIVTIDMMGTKELAEEACTKLKMKYIEKLYLELSKQWYVISENKKPIGYAVTKLIYNGFPRLVKMEDLINYDINQKPDLGDMHAKAATSMSFLDFISKPIITGSTSLYFTPELYKRMEIS